MKYISMREHDENGRTFTSSIMQDDSGNILINVDGHQIVLDDARCIALKEMLEIWQKKNKVELCHENCDACYNCLKGQKGQCRWSNDLKAGVVKG